MVFFNYMILLLVSLLYIGPANGTLVIDLENWSAPDNINVTGNVYGVPAATVFKGKVHMVHRANVANSPLYYSSSSNTDGSAFKPFQVLPQPIRASADPALVAFDDKLVLIYVLDGAPWYATYDGVSVNPFSNSVQLQLGGNVTGAVRAVVFEDHLVAVYRSGSDTNNHGMVVTCDKTFNWTTPYKNGQTWNSDVDPTIFTAPNANGTLMVVQVNNGDSGNIGKLFWSYSTQPLNSTDWTGVSWHGQTTSTGGVSIAPIVALGGG